MRITSGFHKMLINKNIRIGVLGGIGPESSARFYKLVIDRLQKENLKDNTEYPQIIINSIPAPELFTSKNTKIPREYIDGLKLLDKQKPSFIIIVCNTAYAYLNVFQTKIRTPIIDFPKYLSKKIAHTKGKILVIGSSTTTENKIYSHKNFIYLNRIEQEKIDKIISAFNKGHKNNYQNKTLLKIINKYEAKEILAACTEIDIILSKTNQKYISTLNLMVEVSVDKFLEIKKQEA